MAKIKIKEIKTYEHSLVLTNEEQALLTELVNISDFQDISELPTNYKGTKEEANEIIWHIWEVLSNDC